MSLYLWMLLSDELFFLTDLRWRYLNALVPLLALFRAALSELNRCNIFIWQIFQILSFVEFPLFFYWTQNVWASDWNFSVFCRCVAMWVDVVFFFIATVILYWVTREIRFAGGNFIRNAWTWKVQCKFIFGLHCLSYPILTALFHFYLAFNKFLIKFVKVFI